MSRKGADIKINRYRFPDALPSRTVEPNPDHSWRWSVRPIRRKASHPRRHFDEIPASGAASADLASRIKPGNRPLTFQTAGQEQEATLVPLNSLFDRRDAVYRKA